MLKPLAEQRVFHPQAVIEHAALLRRLHLMMETFERRVASGLPPPAAFGIFA
ncbi:hypothetical protein D3C75_1191380 [compost metagenome]